jgi:hypothetical protein
MGLYELMLWELAYEAPWMLCCLAGMASAFLYRRAAPRPSMLVALGCTMLLTTALIRCALNMWTLLGGEFWPGLGLSRSEWLLYWLSILTTSIAGVGVLVLVAAALGGRTLPPSSRSVLVPPAATNDPDTS